MSAKLSCVAITDPSSIYSRRFRAMVHPRARNYLALRDLILQARARSVVRNYVVDMSFFDCVPGTRCLTPLAVEEGFGHHPSYLGKLFTPYLRHNRTIRMLMGAYCLVVLLSSSNKHQGVSANLAQGYASRELSSKSMHHQP